MTATNTQVRKLMTELNKGTSLTKAALKIGLDRKTAAKYRNLKKLPSELKTPRTYRTRKDPLVDVWDELKEMLEVAPELQATTLLAFLQGKYPGEYDDGLLRTLQRRLKRWRAQEGPPKEAFFPQVHRAGERIQTDFTSGNELRVTIQGAAFDHLLCNVVLPFSGWAWPTVCRTESLPALRRGVQEALFKLGKAPKIHQTDNSTAATHRVGVAADDVDDGNERRESGRRGTRSISGAENKSRRFNRQYLDLMEHLGMEPVTTKVGAKEQNGSVEAKNRTLKNRLEQYLLLRGSRDFESVAAYEAFVMGVQEKANECRREKLSEELRAMKPLTVKRAPDWTAKKVRVRSWSTIHINDNTYSVPSRLIGERVDVRIFDDVIEVWHEGVFQFRCTRLIGKGQASVNYRHVIASLVRKPGAFERYRYREEMFPTTTFRFAFDALLSRLSSRKASLEYLRLLQLAADESETDVDTALRMVLDEKLTFVADDIRALVTNGPAPQAPDLEPPPVNLADFDALLSSELLDDNYTSLDESRPNDNYNASGDNYKGGTHVLA